MSAPLVLDAVGGYRRVSGPAIVSRGAGLADIVAIEDGGALNWFTGRLPAIVGTGWSGPVTEPSGVAFDPGRGLRCWSPAACCSRRPSARTVRCV